MFTAIAGNASVGNCGIVGKFILGIGIAGGKGIPGILKGILRNSGNGIFIERPGMFIVGKLRFGNSGNGGSLNGKVISGNLGGKEKGTSIGKVYRIL